MKISILNITKRGVPNEERLVLKVLNDANLSYFVVFESLYLSTQSIKSGGRRAYWFGPKAVKAGDTVVLYTKDGTPSERKLQDGTTMHFLFWGLKQVVWDKVGNCAVLMELNSWQTSKYE